MVRTLLTLLDSAFGKQSLAGGPGARITRPIFFAVASFWRLLPAVAQA